VIKIKIIAPGLTSRCMVLNFAQGNYCYLFKIKNPELINFNSSGFLIKLKSYSSNPSP